MTFHILPKMHVFVYCTDPREKLLCHCLNKHFEKIKYKIEIKIDEFDTPIRHLNKNIPYEYFTHAPKKKSFSSLHKRCFVTKYRIKVIFKGSRGKLKQCQEKKLNKAQKIFIMLLLLWFESTLNGVESRKAYLQQK